MLFGGAYNEDDKILKGLWQTFIAFALLCTLL